MGKNRLGRTGLRSSHRANTGGSEAPGCSRSANASKEDRIGPAVRVGFALGTQIRKALFQVPVYCCRKMAVRASTVGRCQLYFYQRAYRSRQSIERCEVTGIAPTQPGKTLLAQSGASRPGRIGQTRATGCAGQRIQSNG